MTLTSENPLNQLDKREGRWGYGFNNPVMAGNEYFDNDTHFPGWGYLVTPDEQRYISLFGNDLIALSGANTITDDVLSYYEKIAIGIVERSLAIDIIPRVVLYDDPIESTSGNRIPRQKNTINPKLQEFIDKMNDIQKMQLLVREQGYPYRKRLANHYLFTQLNRRPLQEVFAVKMVDPIQNTIIDLFPYRREFKGLRSYCQFFPTNVGNLNFYPLVAQGISRFQYPFENYPDAITIDYLTGYTHSGAVPHDLRELVRWVAGYTLLNDYGDGKMAGVASASASLNSISESFSTTQSAENAFFGARIAQFKKQIKEWMETNMKHYTRDFIGVL